jgi:glycosyltransferase involved in cell wall biosynthesis
MFTLLIPVFNEEQSIEQTVLSAKNTLEKLDEDFEIVVINDGSTDRTAEILAGLSVPEMKIVNHKQNRGYGASMKTGIRHSLGEVIGTTDADGTYPIEQLGPMMQIMREKEADMIVGARTKKGVKIPLIRRPAKAIVNMLANSLVGMRIPDTNSGLRIFTREMAERYMHLYPQGFSFTLTITLASLTNDHIVEFHSIDYFKRQGKSSMSSGINGVKHFINFLGLIIRITTYFRPIRFFIWPSMLLMLSGLGIIIYTISADSNISDAGMLLLLTGLQVGLFGLLAEVVVRHSQKN